MNKIKHEFSIINNEFLTKNTKELIFYNFILEFSNLDSLKDDYVEFFNEVKTNQILQRKEEEVNFHTCLTHQLFSKMLEVKFSSDFNIFTSRKIVSTSSDCISFIQLLIRDNIHLHIHFRSSDFDNVLPVDIGLSIQVLDELFNHLTKLHYMYDEISEEVIRELKTRKILLNLSFGSLHRIESKI